MLELDPNRDKVSVAKLADTGNHFAVLPPADQVQLLLDEAGREIIRHVKAHKGDPRSPFSGLFEMHIEFIPVVCNKNDG